MVFRDIHPATTHHYLVVPKRHVRNVNELVPDDAELMERLVAAGKQVLGEQGVKDYDDVRYGKDPPCANLCEHVYNSFVRLSSVDSFQDGLSSAALQRYPPPAPACSPPCLRNGLPVATVLPARFLVVHYRKILQARSLSI